MDEIFKQLLENDLLTESTRAQISEQIAAYTATFTQNLREEVEADVRAELGAAWVSEREQLVDNIDTFLSEALDKELGEFKADLERFRDHEVEQAAKIVEMRQAMAETLAEELDGLVDKISAFLEEQVADEFAALAEDLEIARQNNHGQKMFEAFRQEYETNFVDSASVQAKLNRAEARLAESRAQVKKLQSEKVQSLRESKMNQVLAPLTGTAREQMALILQSVATDKLEESYKRFIPRVLREGQEQPTQTALNESTQQKQTSLKTGDQAITESAKPTDDKAAAERKRLQILAGIIQ